jgi:hypothetical protein
MKKKRVSASEEMCARQLCSVLAKGVVSICKHRKKSEKSVPMASCVRLPFGKALLSTPRSPTRVRRRIISASCSSAGSNIGR